MHLLAIYSLKVEHLYNITSSTLTDDLKVNILANVGRGGYLTLVDSRVSDLRILYLERPVFTRRLIDRTKSLIAGVRVPANGEQVNVSVSDPRYL